MKKKKTSKESENVKRKWQKLIEESEETLVVPVLLNATKVMCLFILSLWYF